MPPGTPPRVLSPLRPGELMSSRCCERCARPRRWSETVAAQAGLLASTAGRAIPDGRRFRPLPQSLCREVRAALRRSWGHLCVCPRRPCGREAPPPMPGWHCHFRHQVRRVPSPRQLLQAEDLSIEISKLMQQSKSGFRGRCHPVFSLDSVTKLPRTLRHARASTSRLILRFEPHASRREIFFFGTCNKAIVTVLPELGKIRLPLFAKCVERFAAFR